ncbi:MAG: DUF5003 domain-containing protein [Phocaeicola sp.]
MRSFQFILISALLLSNLAFFSCSDKAEVSVPVVFPELVEKSMEANSSGEFVINASSNWVLTSSVIWCSFLEGGEELQTVYGNAGEDTVKFQVKDTGISFDREDEASFTLTMGGESKVIYKITRPSGEYAITVLDAEGNAITAENPLVIAYGKNSSFSVTSNFTWAVTNAPEWITFEGSISGRPNEDVKLLTMLTAGFAKSPKKDSLSIGTVANPSKYAFPVIYDGIPEDTIEFSVLEVDKARYEFSADGASYFYSTHPEAPKVEYPAPFLATVAASDDKYTVGYLKFDQWGYSVMEADESWFKVADDTEGNLSISVLENSGKERFGAIVVLPKLLIDELGGDFNKILDTSNPDYWTIDKKYEGYVLLYTKQLAEVGGFIVTFDGKTLPIVKLENAQETYGTENVFILSLENKAYNENPIVIKPKGLSQREPVYPDSYWDGVDTKWNGVEMNNSWDTDMTSLINIEGITPNTTGAPREMTIGIIGDDYIGYVLVRQ